MYAEGYRVEPGPGYNPKYRSTVWAVILLAQLGASALQDEQVAMACNYILDHTLTSTGQFSVSGAPSGTIDCLQGNLCWALVQMQYDDPRIELAYEWMARERHRGRGGPSQRAPGSPALLRRQVRTAVRLRG